MKKIIIVGHSHTNCLYRALLDSYSSQYAVQQVHLVNLMKEIKEKEDEKNILLLDYLLEKIQSAADTLIKKKAFFQKKEQLNLVLLFGGSFHNIIGLMKMNPPFDFIYPEFPDLVLDEKAEVIPFEAIKKLLESDIQQHEEMIKKIKEHFSCNILHLGFPPPLEDGEYIMSNIEAYFTDRYKNPKLSPRNLRFKLWHLYSNLFQNMCKKHSIVFIPPPSKMIDDEMFLKKEAYLDTIHANHLYAESYIDSLKISLV